MRKRGPWTISHLEKIYWNLGFGWLVGREDGDVGIRGGIGGLTSVNTRTEYNRTMLAMHENAPRAKIARSADFSRMGRWMLRRRGRGRMRMKMSIRMFAIDVAVPMS
jgi:hypothetical protein